MPTNSQDSQKLMTEQLLQNRVPTSDLKAKQDRLLKLLNNDTNSQPLDSSTLNGSNDAPVENSTNQQGQKELQGWQKHRGQQQISTVGVRG